MQSTGLTRQLLAGAHISDPRSQLTILLCFIEAHERTAKTVFDVFGADEGADSVEEMMFEREVALNREAAEEAIMNLGLSEDDIRGERTAVMIKMLERELTNSVKSYVSRGGGKGGFSGLVHNSFVRSFVRHRIRCLTRCFSFQEALKR